MSYGVASTPASSSAAVSGDLALEAAEVRMSFGGTAALRGAHLRVRRGTVHALLGGNGSGKSTLIKCIGGVYRADAGSVTVGGGVHAAGSLTPAVARHLGLRFVHQDLGLFDDRSVEENFGLSQGYPTSHGGAVRRRALRRRTAATLEDFELDVSPTDRVGGLRPSQRSLVAIARALADAPKDAVLLLDEPTTALAENDAAELLAALRRRADRGQTIVLVTHRFGEVERVADDVTVFRDGLTAATGDIGQFTLERLMQVMTGAARVVAADEGDRPAFDGPIVLRLRELSGGAARSVNATVSAGEIVGLAGLGGSGRSSVLRAVAGIAPVRSGDMQLDGTAYRPTSAGAALRRGVALVPENRLEDAAFLPLTVDENISVALLDRVSRGGVVSRRREARVTARLRALFGVTPAHGDAVFSSLSGGNQQKAVLARSVERATRVLLLDEPTQGVDVVARQEIYQKIRAAAAAGVAVLVASSDVDELREITDRVIVLRRGRVVGEIVAELSSAQALTRLMMSDVEEASA
jgi:ribose transport system ATP-binding protein